MKNENSYGNISSESVKKATGIGWDEWIAVLDDAGAANMTHPEVASWLAENRVESAWWCQSVAVGYEQARGLRKPHEKTDGFSVSVSKTISTPISTLYEKWVNDSERARWLEDSSEIEFSTANLNKNFRARWLKDGSQLIVYFYEKGENRCQVVVQCEQLSSADVVEPKREFWKKALARLSTGTPQ